MDQKNCLELLVIQPTPFCNIDCGYCYLPDRDNFKVIADTILEKIFERVFASRYLKNGFTVVWHAGEPTTLPISFYKKAFKIADELRPPSVKIEHSFQTNGTLITQEWCDFIKSTGLKIGVSIDGPEFLNDKRRKTRTGQGTYKKVMHGIELLQKNNIPFNVITVLTIDSLDHPDALIEFYLSNKIRQVGFNIEEIEGINKLSSLDLESVDQKFKSFFRWFFELAKDADGELSVGDIDGAIQVICHAKEEGIPNPQTTPFNMINVDCLGNFSTFSPELLGMKNSQYGDFVFGNVERDSLDSMVSNRFFQKAFEEINRGVESCKKNCEYFMTCGGGAPANKLFENGSFESTETLYCRLTKKAIIDVVLEKLEKVI